MRRTNPVLVRLRNNSGASIDNGGANIHIPVLALIDYKLVVKETTDELSHKELRYNDCSDVTTNQDGHPGSKVAMDINFDAESTQHLVDANEMALKTKHDLATLVVLTMPVVKPVVIERILLIMAALDQFRWAYLHTRVNKRYVFVKLLTLASTKAFVSAARTVFEVKFTSDLVGGVEDFTGASAGTSLLTADVTKLLQQPKGQENLLPLDAAKEYTVDNSELVDVPSHMKPAIIDEIIEFRLKVVRDEARRRAHEAELEQSRAKQKLKEMYERITLGVDNNDLGHQTNTKPVYYAKDEQDGLDDVEYAQYLQNEQKRKDEKQYANMLSAIKEKERTERQKLEEELMTLRQYEDHIEVSRDRYLEELSLMVMGEPSSKWLLLPEIISYHETNFLYYQKRRAEKRVREQSWDEEDRAKESSSRQVELKIDEAPVSKRPHKLEGSDREVIIDAKLSKKIAELSETYVGLVDDTLVDIITSNLKKNGTRGGLILVEDLKEVLDDDAQILVDELFEFIVQL